MVLNAIVDKECTELDREEKDYLEQDKESKKSLMPPHPLTNFEIIEYCKNEPKFNGIYSRNTLPKIKERAYVIDLDHKNTGTHWVVIFVKKMK